MVVTALVPHLIGSFFGVLLLAVAAWRSGAFPKAACALVVVFLVWDFLLPTRSGHSRPTCCCSSAGSGWGSPSSGCLEHWRTGATLRSGTGAY